MIQYDIDVAPGDVTRSDARGARPENLNQGQRNPGDQGTASVGVNMALLVKGAHENAALCWELPLWRRPIRIRRGHRSCHRVQLLRLFEEGHPSPASAA